VRIATPNLATPQDTSDLVSPSHLFQLASIRFESAIATSRIGGPRTAPSAIVAVMALQQAQSGLNSLQSIQVPNTPFDVRNRAARAMDHARHAIDLLRMYHGHVVDLGDSAHPRESLSVQAIGLLDDGRRELLTAIAIARNQ
jgi:hypothetical protein